MKVWLVEFHTHYTKGYSSFTETTHICSVGETKEEGLKNAETLYKMKCPDYSFRGPFRVFEVSEILGYKITVEKI